MTLLDGIPITTVARTLFDVAAVLEHRRFERAVQEADHLRLYDERGLLALLERHPGHRGAVAIRAAAGGPSTDVDRAEFVDRFLALVVERSDCRGRSGGSGSRSPVSCARSTASGASST